jgi:transmembrane sensor
MEPSLFFILAEKYVAGSASEDERAVVEAYWELLSDGEENALDRAALDRLQVRMKANVYAKIGAAVQPAPVKRIYWWRYAAAAAILFAIVTTYLIVMDKEAPVAALVVHADVKAPINNRAMITLGNGKTVYLDSTANGTLGQVGSVNLQKLGDGQIAYTGNSGTVETNTLTNPKGSKVIDIILTDGTHVWLNAGSSLTYTVPLIERNVSVNGEAYFEVTHDASKPFTVTKGETKVTVLGTHFNVNAYNDEAAVTVTLLEGSVRVNNHSGQQLIKPGEQAMVSDKINVVRGIDTDEVMAWKNGLFSFDQSDIETVMRQIARWYDVEVVYESRPEKLFAGGAPRTMSAASVFKALEETGGVHFTIMDKKVIVRK